MHSVTDDEVQVPSANQAISGRNIHNNETTNSSIPPESSISTAFNTVEGNIDYDLHISSAHANEDSQKNNNLVFQQSPSNDSIGGASFDGQNVQVYQTFDEHKVQDPLFSSICNNNNNNMTSDSASENMNLVGNNENVRDINPVMQHYKDVLTCGSTVTKESKNIQGRDLS